MQRKKRILLFWGYQRKAWVAPFEALKDDFEFSFLHYQYPHQEVQVHTTINRHYYQDFKNAQALLDHFHADKLIFMAIDSPLSMLLNIEAKRRGIQTIILQHGVFHSIKTYNELEDKQRLYASKGKKSGGDFDAKLALRFLLKSLRSYNLQSLMFLLAKKYYSRKLRSHEVLQKLPWKARMADRYLVYSRKVAQLFCERDGLSEQQLEEIGFLEYDAFFTENSAVSEKNYFLLIDFPLSPIREYNTEGYGFSHEEVLDYHKRIARFCAKKGAELWVKLHPYQYPISAFVDGGGIRYFRDETPVESLILNAMAVYGFSSSLMLPAIYWKKVCLFRFLKDSDYIHALEQYGVCSFAAFPQFTEEDLNLDSLQISEEQKAHFVRDYLIFDDGKSLQRLKDILNE